MSYNRKNDNFSVVTRRDGTRSFRGGHDDRWNNHQGSNANRGHSRGGVGNRGGRRGGFRHFNAQSARFRNRPGNANLDEDGDIAMSGEFNLNSHTKSRGSHSSSRGRNNATRKVPPKDAWFKIMVPFGATMSENELVDMIKSNINGPFEPIQYSVDDRSKRVYFFIKGLDSADALRSISRRITKSDGHKLVFHVTNTSCPLDNTIDDNCIQKLTLRLSERYDSSTQLLNLSEFHADDELKKDNIYLPLNRATTMAAITKIIAQHTPELVGLDVSRNKLLSLGHMTDLVKVTPNVCCLNLGNNQLRSLDELTKLKGWQNIVEIILKGNDLCQNFSNQETYLSAVRKTFPKVLKLDGTDYPPPITFDLDNDLVLPPTKDSHFGNDDVKNLVVTFIKEYYSIYDSDRRKDLMPAYHDNAQFSLFAVKNPILDRQASLSSYVDDSRNLRVIGHYDSDKLSKKIKTGQLQVISCLESLPKTTHDLNSFKVDVTFALPSMLSFVLQGVFKENETRSDKAVLRFFSRSFVTVPSGPGMVITNDLLTISNASIAQSKAFKVAAPTPSSSPASSTQSVPGAQSSSIQSPEQLQMIERFMADSKMNAAYSLQCLQANDWDYNKAGLIFTDLKNQGRIPPEAFL
ncbi:nuclear RNA export factor 1-like isoform X1 [Biomphalaria pfeifferi]|uniref:Nuclear RNA export factor 1-like isoform X1 n=1 Tax=Biomphalaria pfeifferi TaxID=112525 RepID=A0AAD8BLV7_BIOPF|nr:nuclear RNA export factor 1-like isoform X1 [Biomphalaria pfeifferi]